MDTFLIATDAISIVALLLSSLAFGLACSITAIVYDSLLFERMLLEHAESSLYYEDLLDEGLPITAVAAVSFHSYRNNFAA